jgi:hypothetical protein
MNKCWMEQEVKTFEVAGYYYLVQKLIVVVDKLKPSACRCAGDVPAWPEVRSPVARSISRIRLTIPDGESARWGRLPPSVRYPCCGTGGCNTGGRGRAPIRAESLPASYAA